MSLLLLLIEITKDLINFTFLSHFNFVSRIWPAWQPFVQQTVEFFGYFCTASLQFQISKFVRSWNVWDVALKNRNAEVVRPFAKSGRRRYCFDWDCVICCYLSAVLVDYSDGSNEKLLLLKLSLPDGTHFEILTRRAFVNWLFLDRFLMTLHRINFFSANCRSIL